MVDKVLQGLQWLGHDGFLLISEGKNIYIDPFRISDGLPAADLILITHEHYDHCSPEDVAKIQQASTVIVTEPRAATKLAGEIITMGPGESLELEGITIEAVPSYNINKQFHPQGNRWLGFVLAVGGVRLYHAGDTDYVPEMREVRADIALLPVSGTYVMTAAEAVQAALAINPKIAVPMHYDAVVGTADDAGRFAEGLIGRVRVEILKKR
ncbi:MAG: MBL fold metallo-hydrolase [Desulfobulbaceae bacterium]|nr:MBL fold metallo-hydrolase [Desulfobulbaceae bacterium]HIJ79256.1 MBL fold metallo-hydrolase [Deltaproteobacteria bacterium]